MNLPLDDVGRAVIGYLIRNKCATFSELYPLVRDLITEKGLYSRLERWVRSGLLNSRYVLGRKVYCISEEAAIILKREQNT
ncbi:hypothetical protein [Vulcanisaeta distributa]|uniref:hypothetical protein n=1 Tax=Vulcanisaeta distributa TaxID=164451 RepID=UPI0006CF38B4|nr:hypothetical protein [Vulcanisaeta distributa]